MPYPLPAGSRLLQALGFLAFSLPQVEILMPTKKTRGQELALEQHVANQALHCHQLQIEHVHNSVKCCRIAKTRSACGKRASAMGNGALQCTAQWTGAPDPLAANNFIRINSAKLLQPGISVPLVMYHNIL